MNMMESGLDAVRELKASVAVPFEQARAMPASVYTSQEFLAQELEHIFSREWFCAGRASSLSKPGDYMTLELAGQPVMVIRDHDGTLRAQSKRLPAPDVHAADRFRQHKGHRVPVSRLVLQSRRLIAWCTGNDPERGFLQEQLQAAPGAL
jgi:hypothetical protein